MGNYLFPIDGSPYRPSHESSEPRGEKPADGPSWARSRPMVPTGTRCGGCGGWAARSVRRWAGRRWGWRAGWRKRPGRGSPAT